MIAFPIFAFCAVGCLASGYRLAARDPTVFGGREEGQQMANNRREFIHAAGALAATTAGAALQGGGQALAAPATESGPGVPVRPLGRTGQKVSMLALGGWHIGAVKEKAEATAIIQRAVDEGLTFIDNAWDYHDGKSEEWVGEALAASGPGGARRQKVFLMTKNCERDYQGSMKCLEDSLRRLRTDHIDLWQFHEMIYDNDPDWVFDKGGIKAAVEARKAGKVRFIGFTGHKHPDIHLKMLGKPHPWDTLQCPVNVMDVYYRSFQRAGAAGRPAQGRGGAGDEEPGRWWAAPVEHPGQAQGPDA